MKFSLIYNSRNLLMKFEKSHSVRLYKIYNSRNLLMKFEVLLQNLPDLIYNSRNLLMKFEVFCWVEFAESTTVEIY